MDEIVPSAVTLCGPPPHLNRKRMAQSALPRLYLFFGRRSHFAPLDALQKRPRQPSFSGMAFPMDRTQIQELVAQRVPLSLLRENALQRHGQLPQTRRLAPAALVFIRVYRS